MKKYYCSLLKRNYWTLGYFGGGAIRFGKFQVKAKALSAQLDCNVEDIYIDTISYSTHMKGFKVIFSEKKNQKQIQGSFNIKDFWAFAQL